MIVMLFSPHWTTEISLASAPEWVGITTGEIDTGGLLCIVNELLEEASDGPDEGVLAGERAVRPRNELPLEEVS